jgi:biopolymer transport protein ExbD
MRKHIADIVPAEEESDINLTPMLDVTFILLIFFIVTSSFVRDTGIDNAARPERNQAQVVEERDAILVILDAADDVWIEGRQVDVRAVRAHIERLHAEDVERPLVIQTAPASTAETLVSVMDAARQAGVYEISIADGS